jgi:RNA polymerase sigma factor (sigma-70 family)
MIERNMPLVKSRVGVFLEEYRRFRHLFDDLCSEGFLALTHAVQSFAEREVEKPTGCIVAAIDYALENYVDSEIGYGMMTSRTVQRRRKGRDALPDRLPFDVGEPPVHLWRNANSHVVRKPIGEDNGLPVAGNVTQKSINGDLEDTGRKSNVTHTDAKQFISRYELDGQSDLLDSILACCESEQEQTIVRLRVQGYTDADIGEQLGLSRATVGRRRKEIEQRMKKARP